MFILRFFRLYKTNNVNLLKDDKTLKYTPNEVFNAGIGFIYKFFGFGISYGAPSSENRKSKYGDTQRIDVQVSLLSKAFGLYGFLKIYQGHHISNSRDFLIGVIINSHNYPI